MEQQRRNELQVDYERLLSWAALYKANRRDAQYAAIMVAIRDYKIRHGMIGQGQKLPVLSV